MAQQSKEVNKVAQLLSCLIVILISGNAIKLRILHENFQRMLGAGSDPNVHLVLLRNLFHDCSIQISVTFNNNLTHRQSLHILGSGVGSSSRNSEKSLRDTAEDDENSSSDCMETADQNEAKRRHIPPTTISGTILRMPASLGMLQLFSLERLKFLCVSLETLNDELEHGLRSVSTFFRPFKFWGSARLKKPLKASQLTIKAMLNIAEQLVILYPQPKFLLEFFRLSLTDSLMSQTICQSLRSMMEHCPFQPGEVLLFPQKETPIMSSPDPTECTIGGPATAAVSSLEPMAAVFQLDSSYNSHVRISAELANIDSARISIFRLDSTGSSSLFQDFVFKKFAVGNNLKSLEAPLFSADFVKNFTRDDVDIAFGSKYCNEFDQNNMNDVIYELTTIFGFRGLIPTDLVVLLQAAGPACFCLAECHHSSREDILLFFKSEKFDALITKIFLKKLLLFTVRPTFAHSYSLYSNQYENQIVEESQSVPIDWKTEIVRNYAATLDKSFRTIGGVKLFLFLYALTVERAYSPATQLEALRLLFLVLRRDPAYYDEWKCQEEGVNSKRSPIEFARSGPSLLVRCLASRTAHMDEHIFQELVWFIFSNVVRNDQAKIVLSDRTVIQEPEFLQALISCTDICSREDILLFFKSEKFDALITKIFLKKLLLFTIVRNYAATLDKSFRTIGGVKLFLFLYALTVERAYPPATQLEALRLLFLVLRRDPAYYDEWKCQEEGVNSKRSPIEFARSGPSLLVRCLASRTAHMDEHIFQELVWFIFSNVVRNDQAKIVLSDRTVIQEPEFLQALISCTDIWKGKCFILWIQMTKFVAKCISSSSMIFADDEDNGDRKEGDNLPHKFRQFNLSQLQRVNFLRDFFFVIF
uniref:F-box domain-containing protein n=1 Tax=Globodera pallida TaxID=36090 RepID=A0A183BXV1_GLOPA